MRNVEFNKSKVIKYLLWTFIVAYIVQAAASRFYNSGNLAAGQMIISVMMFVPALGVLFAGGSLKEMGWKLHFRKNIKTILIAWFSPAILTAVGAVLYFLVFPGHFDLSGSYMASAGGSAALEQMEAQGISYRLYVLITAIASITYAPLLNTFLGLGEEMGWRGFLYPQLKAKLGHRKGWLLGGVIWGAWHWPLIWLIGYEYGATAGNRAGYIGFPVTGMLLFCVYSTAMGILADWLYEKSGSIWVPSIIHGAVNASAAMPLAVCLADTGSARLLGPAPNGIIAGLPFLIIAILLWVRADRQAAE